MKTNHGGVRAPSLDVRIGESSKLTRRRSSRFIAPSIELIIDGKPHATSIRKLREIVTVSGRGVRGHFPSYKGRLLKFESLVELDTLHVMVVAALVLKLVTQPFVLQLMAEGRSFRYTPDIFVTIGDREFVVEVKADGFHKNGQTVSRLKAIIAHMRREGIPFLLIMESDVRLQGLQQELKSLLRERPAPGRFDPDLDANEWDPRQLQTSDPEVLMRWRQAQATCDALIQRLIRRDPDAFLETLSK